MAAIAAREGFTFGADPELFVVNADGEFVSAGGLIPGTKEEPHKVEHGAIQVDGMAAEFNIDPVTTYKGFRNNIRSVVNQLKDYLPAGYSLVAQPSVSFDKKMFDAAPDKAKELGCSPDYNAWTGSLNPPPQYLDDPRLRCAGGHLHIGWTEDQDTYDLEHVNNCVDLVKQLDWYLGGWSITQDSDSMRRKLYGKAGACRIKPYGVEYRVLSNFWVLSDSKIEQVWNRMNAAINDMADLFVPERLPYDFSERLVKSIDSSLIDPNLKAVKYPIATLSRDYLSY